MNKRSIERLARDKTPAPRLKKKVADEPVAASQRHSLTEDLPKVLSILPVRNTVVFPGTVVPITVRRAESLKMLEETLPQSKMLGFITQKNAEQEEPVGEDLYPIGAAGEVVKFLRQPDGGVLMITQAIRRFRVTRFVQIKPFLKAEVEPVESIPPPTQDKKWEATLKNLREGALGLMELTPELPPEARVVVMTITDGGHLADFLASNMSLDTVEKQALLEELDVVKRVRLLSKRLSEQLEMAQLQKKLRKDVEAHITDVQRRAYLHEQIKAIQRELGEEGGGAEIQIEQLRKRLSESKPPPPVLEQAERELRRLSFIPPASPEYSIIVSYVETLAELPWSQQSEDKIDLQAARRILDRDHYDLEKVKRRLVEYLAVRKLNPAGRGPILCLVGPPGVGKTSLGQSVADALGRRFTRMSLGGLRDEAEIRGHRRTYIGSMPGRIIQDLRRVGIRNPVMMLDEVDKLGADFRGDPASALLEVLDPRQNDTFVDRYLDVPFDLSQVLFIATANWIDAVPPALRDRMEVLNIPGYTDHDKLQIARRYLVRRQLAENGLTRAQCSWSVGALRVVIDDYTREAGVRELERQIGSVCRAVAAEVAGGGARRVVVTPGRVSDILGAPKYIRETRLKTNQPGVATGLAYTPVGGEVLHVEAARYPGRGEIILTGQIGTVMKESAQAALSLVKSRLEQLHLPENAFKDLDVHIHVPSGAVPKDGPSAGVAMFTAIASLFTQRRVRADVAMTGEITLRGLVLPIGGLKEKALAALRAGVRAVVLPKLNDKDLQEVPPEARKKLKFVLAETVDDVLEAALDGSVPR